MQPFRTLTSPYIVLPNANVDTDQIIPARYLKTVTRTGLGANLFAGWRVQGDGSPDPDFVLNKPEAKGAHILVAGDNFGCGSSREHAPWALLDFGFRAVLSTSIADIFRNNALKNGLLPIVIPNDVHDKLVRGGGGTMTIDLASQKISLDDGNTIPFALEPFARHCLLNGLDEMAFLIQHDAEIAAFEKGRS